MFTLISLSDTLIEVSRIPSCSPVPSHTNSRSSTPWPSKVFDQCNYDWSISGSIQPVSDTHVVIAHYVNVKIPTTAGGTGWPQRRTVTSCTAWNNAPGPERTTEHVHEPTGCQRGTICYLSTYIPIRHSGDAIPTDVRPAYFCYCSCGGWMASAPSSFMKTESFFFLFFLFSFSFKLFHCFRRFVFILFRASLSLLPNFDTFFASDFHTSYFLIALIHNGNDQTKT